MDFTEKTVSTQQIFKGKIFDVSVDTVCLPDGKVATRELVKHPGGVCVVAYEDEQIYLVKQYRKPYDELTIELPAGKLEYGEDHFDAGKRELLEEVGVTAKEFIYLGKAYSSPGFCSETIHVYLALDLEKKSQNLDDEEFLDVLKIPFSKAVEMVMNGEIYDGKTIIGILKSEKILNEKKMS